MRIKALIYRNLAAAIVFAVAALSSGVPVLRGLACLLAFLLASVVATAFQRRKYARPTSRRAATTRPERAQGRAAATLQRQDEISGYGWPTRSAFER